MLELPFYAIASDGSIPLFIGGTLAQRPAPGQPNRLYIVTDAATPYLSRDTGAGWENVGSSEGASSILQKLLTVDTDDSTLNTNFLQGKTAAEFLLRAGGTMTGALTLAGDPTSALHPVTKQMFDALLSGLDSKPDVRLASNTNHALTGAQTVDGVAVVTGDRILLKNQTAGAENGIWVASTTGAWTRATDADTATEIKDMYTFVAEGAVGGNRDTGWLLTTDAITLGTTALVYGQFSGPGSTAAGTGLTRSGNTISASFGSAAGTIAQGNDTRLSDARTPTDATVTPDKMSADNKGVIICASTTRPASPVEGQLIYETDTDQVLKNTGTPAAPVWVNTATASAVANETTAGITQQSTAQQIIDGAAGNLFATVARLKAELDRRGPVDAECELSRTATQPFTNATLESVLWSSEILDPRNWHDNTTNRERITPDAAGRYSGVAYIVWASSTVASYRRVRVLKWVGGVAAAIADTYTALGSASQYLTAGPQVVAFNTRLALGDYLTVEAAQNTGTALDLSPISTFSMARVL